MDRLTTTTAEASILLKAQQAQLLENQNMEELVRKYCCGIDKQEEED
jgi:hypothetical protein